MVNVQDRNSDNKSIYFTKLEFFIELMLKTKSMIRTGKKSNCDKYLKQL